MSDYIPREAAYPLAKKICDAIDSDKFQRLNFGMRILDWIDDIPAADVRPVVRRRWIGNKRHQSCSECHMTYCVPDGQDGELDMTAYHFCPNCGAWMEES